ncbi:cathepsin L1-like [Contarinia nasturtii]|uniref:cathepsin L1-like n=1 Tax=Contarinia nasturtii TaxID=265458 RepID=UPI0012D3A9A6|nr:cathepsin L1-like [Contarinia nasturtii]
MEIIKKHNEEAKMGKHTYELRANSMTDYTQEAYLKRFVRLKEVVHPESLPQNEVNAEDKEALRRAIRHSPNDDTYIPETLDWRDLGFITKPKNQLSCGSCYAFSVATSIEAQIFRRTGMVVPLSAQQFVDCSIDWGNGACQGGNFRGTLQYLQSTNGLMRETDYPYASEQQECMYNPNLSVVNVTRWAILPKKDEKSLVKAIAQYGPIPITINAAPKSFQLYSHGIYSDSSCTDKMVNHAMLAVGYTPDYFILQNWWGDRWGETGYMKIERHRNRCGLANYAAYAMV